MQQSVAGQVSLSHEMGPGARTCNAVGESEGERLVRREAGHDCQKERLLQKLQRPSRNAIRD
jgi:hypothetical protein